MFQLITYSALGLCPPGDAHKLVERGDNTVRFCKLLYSELHTYISEQYGGKYVVNPSGGLEAKGHPLGATGLGMHFYIMSKVHLLMHIPFQINDFFLISATERL